jgi:hypothetical protein
MSLTDKFPGPRTANLAASRMIFKNNSGIMFNISGKVSEFYSQSKSRANNGEINEDAKQLAKKEYCRTGYQVEDDIIKSIQSKMDKYIDSEHAITKKHSGVLAQKKLTTGSRDNPFSFHKYIPEISHIIGDEVLCAVRDYYNGAHVRPFEVILYRNFHIPPEDVEPGVISNQWHHDGDYPDILKIFVNISNVTKDDGPFHLVSRQDSISHMADYEHPRGVPDNVIKNSSNVVRATGPPGTTVIANTNQCLHRAGVPENGRTRDLLQIKLIPSSKPLTENWLEEAKEFDLAQSNRPPNSILS